jgi:hypothetical protein
LEKRKILSKANSQGLTKEAPLRPASFASRLFAALNFDFLTDIPGNSLVIFTFLGGQEK